MGSTRKRLEEGPGWRRDTERRDQRSKQLGVIDEERFGWSNHHRTNDGNFGFYPEEYE